MSTQVESVVLTEHCSPSAIDTALSTAPTKKKVLTIIALGMASCWGAATTAGRSLAIIVAAAAHTCGPAAGRRNETLSALQLASTNYMLQ
eukprot:COSAG01_NODE_2272_length_8023_cov_2.962140_7_plen_90_part_00